MKKKKNTKDDSFKKKINKILAKTHTPKHSKKPKKRPKAHHNAKSKKTVKVTHHSTRPKKHTKIVQATKPKKIEKVNTGIPNFDKLIEGGLEKNSANVVVGAPGSGKTIFATQFLLQGMKNGEKCLYVTFEEKKEQFYEHMLKFGWDLTQYEKKGLFTFLEYTPIKVKTMLEEGGGAIENTIVHEKITRIVIDSITSFALLFDDELERREAALTLFSMIGGWNCTSLLTLEEDPLTSTDFSSKTIEFESDSIILLYYLQQKTQRTRCLEILKMRGVQHSNHVHKFEIGKKGITVFPKRLARLK